MISPPGSDSPENTLQPKAMLIASRALAASRPSLIAFLVTRGGELSGGIADSISFCNILFVGNMCAALVVAAWFGLGNILEELKSLSVKSMAGLVINGIFATLLSTLIFLGLQETSVTNAVLLGRFGPVLYALVGAILLKKKIAPLEWFGFSLITLGIIAIVLKTNDFQINRGDLFILASTIVFAVSALLSKLMLSKVAAVGLIVFVRNLLSSIIFFFIAMQLFGPNHFGDAFAGQLWMFMAIYALIVIVFAQYLWYESLNKLDSRTVGRLTVLSPVFGVTYAFVLNGERPSSIQAAAFVVIMIGVLITTLRKTKEPTPTVEMMNDTESAASAQ